ncbi:hypothetical protein Hanom_Chr17g01574391 [Helianthus anomalus]
MELETIQEVVEYEEVGEELMEPLSDPWESSVCEGECDCAIMAAAKVSPHVLKDLCSDKCIFAFANIKEVNENHRNKILDDEIHFEKLANESTSKLFEKECEISITNDQLQTVIEK